MPKQPTIRRDSVFRSTDPDRRDSPAQPVPAPSQGAPEVDRSMRQTAVWLADDELDWLDQECRKLRRAGWRSVNRSIVIRAILDARMGHEPDYGGVQSERELSQRFEPAARAGYRVATRFDLPRTSALLSVDHEEGPCSMLQGP